MECRGMLMFACPNSLRQGMMECWQEINANALYLDMCTIKRPFDDQTQVRIRLETEAVDAILAACQQGEHQLVSSDALLFENARNPNQDRQSYAARILAMGKTVVMHSTDVSKRAREWLSQGIMLLDALHLASAESAAAEYFVSSDDQLRHRSKRVDTSLRICSPLELVQELSK